MLDQLDQLALATGPAVKEVTAHPLYSRLTDEAAVRTFMEHHVWAVWDFMSLLKSLQRGLTCVEVPWLPTSQPRARRLVNEIVLAEESDELRDLDGLGGGYLSHFELYLAAMEQARADTGPVRDFLARLKWGEPVLGALFHVKPPRAADAFVADTFALIADAPLHAQAAAFAFGREELIPAMFEQVTQTGRLAIFADYLARHVELDADEHGPMAMAMVCELCGTDAGRWADAQAAVSAALLARRRLWDGTLAAIDATAKDLSPARA